MDTETSYMLTAADVTLSWLKVAADRAIALDFNYIAATYSGVTEKLKKDAYFRVYRSNRRCSDDGRRRVSSIQ